MFSSKQHLCKLCGWFKKFYETDCSHFWMCYSGMRKNGPWKNAPRKMVPRKNGPRKMVPEKNDPREKWSLENWSPENWSPEKCPSKIVLRQKNARKLKRFFIFINWFYTPKKMFDVYITILHLHQTVEH